MMIFGQLEWQYLHFWRPSCNYRHSAMQSSFPFVIILCIYIDSNFCSCNNENVYLQIAISPVHSEPTLSKLLLEHDSNKWQYWMPLAGKLEKNKRANIEKQ